MDGNTGVILHLGAHKTASTHLQLALKRGRPWAGGRVFVPDDLRKDGLRVQDWLGPAGGDAAHGDMVRAAFAGAGRLLISDENLLGQVPGPGLTRDPTLYPQAGARLARLAGVLPPGPVTLALAVREGAGFLAACHAQALMAGRVAPYDALFGGLDPAALSWDDLAARLLAALPQARLVVWDHAEWPAVAPQVGRALLGSGAVLPLPPGTAHPSLSAPAVAALLTAAPRDPAQAQALARELRARFPRDAGHPAHAPLTAAARAAARAALAHDLAALARRPGASVLRPG